jgi:outer membrane protein OmpA-like peptidoglycan-associated protein
MRQKLTWNLYPLLNYVFFDLGSSDIPERYVMFKDNAETKDFADTTITGGTLDKYYHLLNIYGYRLTKNPDSKIEIVGCNDGTTSGEKRSGLSKERATNVYNYLRDVWKIDESRMKLVSRDKPQSVSNLKDSLGITENRRVEIVCDWEIMKPVFDVNVTTYPDPENMNYLMKNGIEDALVTKRRIEIARNGQAWNTLTNIGTVDPSFLWDWKNTKNKYPQDEGAQSELKDLASYTAKLIVTTGSGRECESESITIPVKFARINDRVIAEGKDSTDETYNLVLFPFDSPKAGPINERIMRDYVYERCMTTSSIEVIGHTDVVGLYERNMKLSNDRANTVTGGINKSTSGSYGKLDAKGVGEDEPLYTNDLPEGRFYNRTVQVRIKTPLKDLKK